jgi:starch-binding outer membrane protein, SusD/RagB family
MKHLHLYTLLLGSSLTIASCTKPLEVTPTSEISTENVLTTEAGIRAVLNSSYGQMQSQTLSRLLINEAEVSTDLGYNTNGAENVNLSFFINFTWDASLGTFATDVWEPNYRSIRDANNVIENIDKATVSDANKKLYKAEARVLRAFGYVRLYNYFGAVPLRTSVSQPADLVKATDEEIRNFIETEITEAVTDLPNAGAEAQYGRLNKGIAWSILSKFYLNTKQWQKAADASFTVINYGYYALYPDFGQLFRVENEGKANKEMILVLPCFNQADYGNWFMAGAMPPAFASAPEVPGFVYNSGMSIFATNYRLRDNFVKTFSADDKRKNLIITQFVNQSGATVDLTTTADNCRSFKYWDNSIVGNNGGADVPLFRYADILLTRAEALNEISGPVEECFTRLNEVRKRAGLANLTLAETPTADAFRDAILRERGWEFVSEGKRREDLIRHNKFLSSAIERGVPAAIANDKKLVFPIPQTEINANKLIRQNDGY